MRYFCFIIRVVFFLTALSVQGQAQDKNFVRVSRQHPHYFETADGKTYIPVGLNLCWPRFISDEAEGLAKMDFYFKELSRYGGNYARIWLSAPFWEIETTKAGEYDTAKIHRLDKLLALAKKYNIKLKFCLEHFRQLTNSPARFPGSVPFDRPAYHDSNNGPLRDMSAYLETKEGHALFLNRAKWLALRYAGNPDVFGWELWNEMDAVKGKGWEEWTGFMLNKLHSLFPNHLIMQSLGSYDNEAKIALYKRITSLPANEVAQVHRYLDAGAKWEVCKGSMENLAAQATRELVGFSLKKPVLAAEIGAVEANHAGPWALYPKDKEGLLLHDMLFAPFFSGGAGPGHSWHWDSYIEKNNLWWHFGRFVSAIKDFDPVRQKAVPFTGQLNGEINLYGLKGKEMTLIWLRDAATTWETELVRETPARSLQNQKLLLRDISFRNVWFYDPWKDVWSKGKVSGKTVTLPRFSRSLVIKLEMKR